MGEASPATRLRERLRGGAPIVGTFVKLPALESIDLVHSIGFDLACIDGEHSQLDERAILSLLRHGAALDFPLLVRTPSRDAGSLNRMLEAGAAGIQLSPPPARSPRDAPPSAAPHAPPGTPRGSPPHSPARCNAGPPAPG